jgi:hypothetical protein
VGDPRGGDAIWHYMLTLQGAGETDATEVLGGFLGRLREALLPDGDLPDGKYNVKTDRLVDEGYERSKALVKGADEGAARRG